MTSPSQRIPNIPHFWDVKSWEQDWDLKYHLPSARWKRGSSFSLRLTIACCINSIPNFSRLSPWQVFICMTNWLFVLPCQFIRYMMDKVSSPKLALPVLCYHISWLELIDWLIDYLKYSSICEQCLCCMQQGFKHFEFSLCESMWVLCDLSFFAQYTILNIKQRKSEEPQPVSPTQSSHGAQKHMKSRHGLRPQSLWNLQCWSFLAL